MESLVSVEDRDEMAIPSYRHANPLMRWMAWRRLSVMSRRLEAIAARRRPSTVLDFGCGTGVLLEAASRLADRVIGVDRELAPAAHLVEAWHLDQVSLQTPDEIEGLAPGSVDVIVAGEVLEHIDPLAPLLVSFERLLAPGGTLLASLPTESGLYRLGRRLAGFSGHYHHAGAAQIDGEIRRAGLRARRLEKVPAPGPLAIYWVIEYEP